MENIDSIVFYNSQLDQFEWDSERLRKAGIDERATKKFRRKEERGIDPEVVFYFLLFKGLKDYIRREKIISLEAIHCLQDINKTVSKGMEVLEKEGFTFDFSIDPNLFTQEEILQFYENRKSAPLQGIAKYIHENYKNKKRKLMPI